MNCILCSRPVLYCIDQENNHQFFYRFNNSKIFMSFVLFLKNKKMGFMVFAYVLPLSLYHIVLSFDRSNMLLIM